MAKPRISSIDGKLAEEFAVPSHVEEVKEKMSAFARHHADAGRRVVLITSGGTKVPLESRTVRFLDNFSSGRRGASSAEYFLDSGYAVIFLHRHRSLYPYARMFSTINMLDALKFSGGEEGASGNSGEVVVNRQVLPNIAKALTRYQEVKEGKLLLPIEFSTLSEYLHLLKAAAQALSTIGNTLTTIYKLWLLSCISFITCLFRTQDPRACFTWLQRCLISISQHLRCLSTKSSLPTDLFK